MTFPVFFPSEKHLRPCSKPIALSSATEGGVRKSWLRGPSERTCYESKKVPEHVDMHKRAPVLAVTLLILDVGFDIFAVFWS